MPRVSPTSDLGEMQNFRLSKFLNVQALTRGLTRTSEAVGIDGIPSASKHVSLVVTRIGYHRPNKYPLLFVICVLETQLPIWRRREGVCLKESEILHLGLCAHTGYSSPFCLCDQCPTEQLDGGGDRLKV